MNVNFDNKTYSFTVAPGSDGYRQFTQAIRKAFHLPEDSEHNITFTCDEPSSGGCGAGVGRGSSAGAGGGDCGATAARLEGGASATRSQPTLH
jgi:hypothetical protein